MSDPAQAENLILYYLRTGWYRRVQELALQQGRELLFWKATALWKEDGVVPREREAIREMETCLETGPRDYSYAASRALAWFHANAQYPDAECVRKYEARAVSEGQDAGAEAKAVCGRFFLLVGALREARELADGLAVNRVTASFLAWCRYEEALQTSKKNGQPMGKDVHSECLSLLEQHVVAAQESQALRISQLDGLMLKAKLMETSKNWAAATEYLNQAIVYFPWFVPAIQERAKVYVACGDWEQALETCSRLDDAERPSANLDSLKVQLLHLLARGRAGAAGGGASGARSSGGAQQFGGSKSILDEAATRTEEMLQLLAQREPYSGFLQLECVQLFSRLCGRSRKILRVTQTSLQTFVETVIQTRHRDTSPYLTELGFQHLLLEDVKKAAALFAEACARNGEDIRALLGQIHCRIFEGHAQDAGEQLEFLKETQSALSGRSSYSSFLQALVARRLGKQNALQLLNEALTVHISDFRSNIGYEFYLKLDPEYMMGIANEYLAAFHETEEGGAVGGKKSSQLTRAIQVLETLSKFLPGNLWVQTALARAKLFMSNQTDEAIRLLENCLAIDPAHAEGYLLLARTHYEHGDVHMALRILEQGISRDFGIRSHPLYGLVKAKMIQQERGDNAIQVLEEVLRLPGVRTAGAAAGQARNNRGGRQAAADASGEVTPEDRVSIFLLLVQLYGKAHRVQDATNLLQEAGREFKNSKEEVRVLVAQAELYSEMKGEVDKALALLETASAAASSATVAKTIKKEKAKIYLHHKHDMAAYARCYREILLAEPENVENHLALGEALLEIGEPQEAIQTFEKALSLGDKRADATELIRKIGSALVLTHDYETGMNYYANALKRDPTAVDLRLDLARLHMKLENWPRAGQELDEALHAMKNEENNVKQLQQKIELLRELAKVHLEQAMASMAHVRPSSSNSSGDQSSLPAAPLAAEKLGFALQLQEEVLDRLRAEDDEPRVEANKKLYAEIAFQLADYYHERKPEEATRFYLDCLRHNEVHEEAMLNLAKLKMAEGNYEACEKQLLVLLRLDSSSSTSIEASTLMAELLMILAANGSRSEGGVQEYRDATYHYRQLLERKPCDWRALSRLVYLLKRSGKVKEFDSFLTNAKEKLKTYRDPEQEPGFRFCRGLHARCVNRPSDALVDLNFARTRDAEFRRDATLAMIDIYLYPDPNKLSLEQLQDLTQHSEQHSREVELLIHELLQSESQSQFQATGAQTGGAAHHQGASGMGSALAGGAGGSSSSTSQAALFARLRVYQAQNAIFTKKKTEVDRGLQMLMEFYNEDKNFVPGVLAMAQGLIISKQLTKARNQLKRIAEIARKAYNPDWADDFEKAWLLLADVYISQGKYELASTLCHLASMHNRSSGKSWENLGLIYEKEQGHKDAAAHYEKAWELSGHSANVGFRLAFNYLKAKRNVECVLICQQVLTVNPSYPKIQKEILDKARAQLRV